VTRKQTLGNKGEEEAGKYVQNKGYKILGKNYCSKFGEIDLIARDKDELIFIEVKARSNDDFGLPEQEFNARKKKRLRRVIQSYLWEKKATDDQWRVDLITVDYSQSSPRICHYQNLSLESSKPPF